MSPKQTTLYWREWASVKSACQRQGLPVPDRHTLHRQALGHDQSSKHLSNDDFDRVLAEFRAISQPDNLAAQLRQLDQPRRRLLYTIRQLAPEPYWKAIALDKFGTADETQLDTTQLHQLRLTLSARHPARTNAE